MTLLYLAIASLVFIVWFTWHAAMGAVHHRAAIVESWTNLIAGFFVNFLANIFLLPLVGAHLSVSSNFQLGLVYTAISLVRSYCIRRWFHSRQC